MEGGPWATPLGSLFGSSLLCAGRLGGDSEGALISRDLQESRDSVCDSCVPFTVPVQSKAPQSPLQSCPQARRKLLGLEQNRRQDLSFLTLSLQPFLHPFAPRPLSYRISLCPPFPRRQSSKRAGSPLNSCNIYCRNKEWGQRGFWSQLEMKDNRRLTGKLGLVL